MVDSTWVPVVSAAVGGFFGVAGALGTQALTGRREKRTWERARKDRLRDARGQLYLDLMEYTQDIEGVLDRVTDPRSPVRKTLDGLVSVERLTARVELYIPEPGLPEDPASSGPAAAWDELLVSHAALEWAWEEGDTEVNNEGKQFFHPDDPAIVRCRAAVKSMKTHLKLWLTRDI